MKVAQVPYCFYPDPVGGTEVYVESLCRHLNDLGIDSFVAAASDSTDSYSHFGLEVRRYAVQKEVSDNRELFGEGDVHAAEEFGQILDAERPDVVHFHAFTRGASVHMIKAARKRRIPILFTYHTPTVSCQRGTLMRWGRDICDGVLNANPCAACTLESRGLNRWAARVAGAMPPAVGRLAGSLGLNGGAWTVIRMTDFIALRNASFHEAMRLVDTIVAPCTWVCNLLVQNGISLQKIVLSRQGVAHQHPIALPAASGGTTDKSSPLRIAFLGRLNPTKGLHVLLNAFLENPTLRAEFDVFGISSDAADDLYTNEIIGLIERDVRVSLKPSIAPERVISTLGHYDILAVPSLWMETGPLVVLEAFAAGIPVLGSRLGGIAELVTHGVNGLLIEPGSVTAWADALDRLSRDPQLILHLRDGVSAPRTMAAVADEMHLLYSAHSDHDTRASFKYPESQRER